VATSLDGLTWTTRVDLPEYEGPLYWSAGRPVAHVRSGRVEVRLPGEPVRHVRLRQTGRHGTWPWTVRELHVYRAAEARPSTPPPSGAALARAVREAGAGRLYADHGWAARVALADPAIAVPPANLALDSYNHQGGGRDLLPPVGWGPGVAALLEPEDAGGVEAVLRGAGLGVARRPVGPLVLLAGLAPPPAPGIPLPAGALALRSARGPAGAAADGDRATRWSTGRPQQPGDWLEVGLDAPRRVRAVRVWSAFPTDWPRGLALEGTEDGTAWRPLAAEARREGPLRWGGVTVVHDGVTAVRLDFPPATLRALRLVLTGGDPVYDWSVHELTVYAAD
jgi:hypothetical protein